MGLRSGRGLHICLARKLARLMESDSVIQMSQDISDCFLDSVQSGYPVTWILVFDQTYDLSIQRTSMIYGRIQDGWQVWGGCVWGETRENVILFTLCACQCSRQKFFSLLVYAK